MNSRERPNTDVTAKKVICCEVTSKGGEMGEMSDFPDSFKGEWTNVIRMSTWVKLGKGVECLC